jgi:[acyl-carrier-protein] S-malonyltransferase
VSAPPFGLLFPGQGSQHVGMGRDLAERFPLARETFEEADEVLGTSLSRLCWEGPEEELTRTRNAQPAILVHGIAVWRLVRDALGEPAVAAGHSLGEFAAYAAAGALEFPDAVRVVRRRGELMFEAGQRRPGTMAAVLGLDDEAVEHACREASGGDAGVVVAANLNAPGQTVISGDVAAVGRAGELLRAAGARRVLPLSVSGAFHSPLMQEAEEGLRAALEEVPFRDPAFAVVSNARAEPVREAARARELLVEQLTSPVRWVASVLAVTGEGTRHFVELGPGSVLTGLLRRIHSDATGRALGTADQVDALLHGEVSLWN